MDKNKALEILEKAMLSAASWEKDTGAQYAAVVGATAVCIRKKCSRAEIAKALKKHSKGSVSRYILLANKEIERNTDAEVGGQHFTSPVSMLATGQFSLSQAYFAFRGPRKAKGKPPVDPVEAGVQAINRLVVVLSTGRTKVIENLGLCLGAMTALLHAPATQGVIPERERKRFQSVMTKSLGVEAQAA